MTVFDHRPTLRWSVPLLAAAVLGAGGSAVGVITATAGDGLPQRSASQLLVDVQKARLDGLSGTIVQNADLGLPSLPGIGGGGSSDLSSMVSGSHTLRLWYAGPNRVRLSLLGSLGESDVVRNGTDLWVWSSDDKTAVHRSVPRAPGAPQDLASMSPLTPQQAAETALDAITPTTRVSTAGTARVAGRSAYELLLQPRDTRSLVASVRIAIDGKTHVPTRVQVFAKNTSKPAVEIGFTSFNPSRPAASVFRFNPPPGTKVTEGGATTTQGGRRAPALPKGLGQRTRPTPDQRPTVVGTGWTSVVRMKVPTSSSPKDAPASAARMLRMLPKASGAWGSGHLLRGRLFSALLTDDGRLVAGAVPPAQLYAALAKR